MLNPSDNLKVENPVTIKQISGVSSKDVDEVLKLLQEIPVLTASISDTLQNISRKVRNDELNTSKGLSFLDLKNYMFLNYMMNINYIIMQKLSGKKIENDPAIERLIELRIVLERMRPIDEKLKYQIDKLQSALEFGNFDESNPLRFRANPQNLHVEDEDEISEEELNISGPRKATASGECNETVRRKKKQGQSTSAEEIKDENEKIPKEEKRPNAYVPPKISAAYFDEDMTLEERKKKILQRSKKRAFSSSVLHELRKEYDTGPEEIKETVDPYKIKLNEELKERTRYEEEFMTRLPMMKKHRHETRQLTTVTNFDMKFGNISALDMETDDVSLQRKSSKKKGKFSRKPGKKKGKKRHH